MKIGIQQKVLEDVVTKGSIAALSEEAQADTSTLSLLIKSVKITVDSKSITVESGTSTLAIKYTIPVNEENGIIVKEEGSVLVPAKELLNWVSLQGDSNISLSLQKFSTPEIINMLGDNDFGDQKEYDSSKFTIKKIGTIKLISKSTSKTNKKWEIDCYEPTDFATVDFNKKADKCFEIQGNQFIEAISAVSFAAKKKDPEHVLDGISMQYYNEGMYFCATDDTRLAVYIIDKDMISNIDSTRRLLVPAILFGQILKILDKEAKITISYNEEIGRVFIAQNNLKVRLANTDKEHVNKFPNIKMLIDKEYSKLVEMPKAVLNDLLINTALVNNSSARFAFNKTDSNLIIMAISENDKYKPAYAQAPMNNISKDISLILGVSTILDGLKVIKSNEIHISVPASQLSVKITGKDISNFYYFCPTINNDKYKKE